MFAHVADAPLSPLADEPRFTVYVMFCEMNTQDGRDHYQLGMYRMIRIVK
jgi:hypothetical protein